MQVLDARLGDVYTGGDGGSSPAGGAVDATVVSPGGGPDANSHDQRASFDSDAAVQVRRRVLYSVVQLLMRRLGPQCRMPGEAGRFGNGAWAVLQAVLGHEDSDDGDVVVAELTTHRASVQFLVRRASTGLARFASFWLC